MRKLLDIRIGEDGLVTFESEYKPLKGMNLYQQVFVTLLFEADVKRVRRWLQAIEILSLADVCASRRPELAMSMFERTMDELAPVCMRLKSMMGGNLNFKPAVS